ncbi:MULTISPECIES: DEAD/DEAH box helicase [Persephonella]|uniref:DEAD-box ATP-dependent RNA helicase RhpA n=1 Tax=Persephonella marina (strain DSM 14350 / EX-H1) TaxID=123214 RepID=C0QPU9_PERMH|nr:MULTISPECIES: DEAD/DEAH box helicase [Persephonella]ACO03146.1 dead/deah box helicase domain protein [Persephonella marina EX-H1]
MSEVMLSKENLSFNDFQISKETLNSIRKMGFKKPTEVQEKTIPLILEGKDIIAQAQTGTGKTAAFGIPIVETVNTKSRKIQALVLVPTRELAIQVTKEIKDIGREKRIFALAVYGGKSIRHQIDFLKKGKDVVIVGTPGRIKDLIERKVLNLNDVKIFVLDEADRMLDMGFIEDIEFIFEQTPPVKQTLLFSATMPKAIMRLAERFLNDDYEIVKIKPEEVTVDRIKQKAYRVDTGKEFETLTKILNENEGKKSIVFTETKRGADELSKKLRREGFNADAIHGDYSQAKRERVLRDFRRNRIDILVATDVAARGLDIKGVDVVYNYSLPRDVESYIHRIGRTGRAGKDGLAISIISTLEDRLFEIVKKKTRSDIQLINLSDKPIEKLERRDFTSNRRRRFLRR